MINSATALELMTEEIGEPITVDGIVGVGLLRSKVRVWLGRRGFRTDTERSTLNRWLKNWVDFGLLIPVNKDVAYWVASVPPEKARRVMYDAYNSNPPQVYLYDPNSGQIHEEAKPVVEALLAKAGVVV